MRGGTGIFGAKKEMKAGVSVRTKTQSGGRNVRYSWDWGQYWYLCLD